MMSLTVEWGAEHPSMTGRRKLADILLPVTCMLPAALGASLWVLSSVMPLGGLSLRPGTTMNVMRGEFRITHVTAYCIAPAVPEGAWYDTAAAHGWTDPSRRTVLPWFGHSSGHVMGVSGTGAEMVSPASYSLTFVPTWVLGVPTLLLVPLMLRRLKRFFADRRRGFLLVSQVH